MKEFLVFLITLYLVIMNVIGLVTMGVDKKKAIKRGWRIPERTLLLIAFLGGSIGSFLGMKIFRHKTKHLKFQILVPLAVILHIILYIILAK